MYESSPYRGLAIKLAYFEHGGHGTHKILDLKVLLLRQFQRSWTP